MAISNHYQTKVLIIDDLKKDYDTNANELLWIVEKVFELSLTRDIDSNFELISLASESFATYARDKDFKILFIQFS